MELNLRGKVTYKVTNLKKNSFLFGRFLKNFTWMSGFLACICVYHICAWWMQRPEKSIGSRGIGVTNRCEQPCGYETQVIVSKKPWLSSLYRFCMFVGCMGESVQCVQVVCLWACTNMCKRGEVWGPYQMSSALHLYFLRQYLSPNLQHFHSAGVAAQWSSGISFSLPTPHSRLGL